MSRKDERMLWISLVAALIFVGAVFATLWAHQASEVNRLERTISHMASQTRNDDNTVITYKRQGVGG